MKYYIGDSVYMDMDDYGNIILTTENGGPTPGNRIILVLEPRVWEELCRCVERENAKRLAETEGSGSLRSMLCDV